MWCSSTCSFISQLPAAGMLARTLLSSLSPVDTSCCLDMSVALVYRLALAASARRRRASPVVHALALQGLKHHPVPRLVGPMSAAKQCASSMTTYIQ
jgi:hypothetical protein